MPVSRLVSMQETVGRFVPAGASVCMGTAREAHMPFAAGCVRHIQAAWVGNISTGLGHNYQRAVEHGALHRSDPGLVLAPALKVTAVVHEPFGACPSPVHGYYRRGHELFHRYHGEMRTVEGAWVWFDHSVFGVADSRGYLSTLRPEAREAVRVKTPRLSEPLDYGA